MEKLTIGQEVILVPRRYWLQKQTGKISKIGKKYFWVSDYKRFELVDLNSSGGWSDDYYVFTSEQAILDDKERKSLQNKIADLFRYHTPKLSLDQLRRINAIVEESGPGCAS